MSYRSPCVPAYRCKFCSVWWIVSGSPRSRPRRRWDRGPVILAFACILAYRGSSKKTTSRHSRSQLPAVFSPVRPLFQRGLDSPTTIKNEIYDTFVHSCPSLDAVYYTLSLFLKLGHSVVSSERSMENRWKFRSNYRGLKRLKIARRSRSGEDSPRWWSLIMEWNGSIYQTEKNLHRLALPSTFPLLAPLDAGPVPGTSRCNRLAVSHEVQIDVVPVRAAKALRACWTGNVGLRPHWWTKRREKYNYLDRLNVFNFI